MKVVVQRCKDARVTVNGNVTGKIDSGYVLFTGFTTDDTIEIMKKVAKKIIDLRIFDDENDKMNYDIKTVNGSILSISQFTLYAKLNGRRPSFSDAMKYDEARDMYNKFNEELRTYGINVETGEFGGDMKVELLNDGPVTILIDSKEI